MEAGTQPAQIESFDPATGERLGSVPATDPADVGRIVADMAAVQPFWAQLRVEDRARYMRRAAQVIIDHLDPLTTLLTKEQGRPRAESYSVELLPTVDALHWLADHGPKLLRDRKARPAAALVLQRRAYETHGPLGVVGVRGAWDHPWSRPFTDAAFALMAGNGVLVQPSTLTPLIGQRIQRVFERAGLPDGIVCTVQGEAPLTGVTRTFEHEPGEGERTHIVLADANLDHAVAASLWTGGRVYVVRKLAGPLVEGLVEIAGRLRVGHPASWDTDVGPIVSEWHYERLREAVDAAVAHGATINCGGPLEPPRYYSPAVLTAGTAAAMPPGPVVQVVAVASEEEALAQELTRNVSIWTRDRAKGERIARRIDAETVGVDCDGGTRSSLLDHVKVKRIVSDPGRRRDPRWYPYDEALGTALHSAAQLLYGRDEDKRAALQRGAVPLARLGRKALGRRPGARHQS